MVCDHMMYIQEPIKNMDTLVFPKHRNKKFVTPSFQNSLKLVTMFLCWSTSGSSQQMMHRNCRRSLQMRFGLNRELFTGDRFGRAMWPSLTMRLKYGTWSVSSSRYRPRTDRVLRSHTMGIQRGPPWTWTKGIWWLYRMEGRTSNWTSSPRVPTGSSTEGGGRWKRCCSITRWVDMDSMPTLFTMLQRLGT